MSLKGKIIRVVRKPTRTEGSQFPNKFILPYIIILLFMIIMAGYSSFEIFRFTSLFKNGTEISNEEIIAERNRIVIVNIAIGLTGIIISFIVLLRISGINKILDTSKTEPEKGIDKPAVENQAISIGSKEFEALRSEEEKKFIKNLEIYFIKKNTKKYDELVEALNANDIPHAYRLVHGLKSNAGQMGKTYLQQAAAEVEKNLKDGKNIVTLMQMSILQKELNNTIAQLSRKHKAFFDKQDAPQSVTMSTTLPVLDESERELFIKLENLLKTGNPESAKVVENFHNIPHNGFKQLIQHICDFEFDEALSAYYDLKKALKEN